MFADFWSDNILSILGPFLRPSPLGALMEKEGTDNVYLDNQVMGSNPGIRSRSHEESPEFQKPIMPFQFLVIHLIATLIYTPTRAMVNFRFF